MARPTRLACAAFLFFAAAMANHALYADTPVLPDYPVVRPGVRLQFPADHGAHPDYRNEWWYVTGWLETVDGRPLGFQVTFFRTRPEVDQRNPSTFAPKQILLAHVALSDPRVGRLLHDQRTAREGFGRAEASTSDTDIVLDDWTFKRTPDGNFHARIPAAGFALDLAFTPAEAVLLQGDKGFSRKGPDPRQASYYYSLPHLKVSGTVARQGKSVAVKGGAWLDREWSSNYLDPKAVGWDWVGLNLDDGSALMAFQIRDAAGHALWAGGSLRRGSGQVTPFAPQDVVFSTLRRWRSPRTGTEYPVERILAVHARGIEHEWRLTPLFDDQELDSRAAGGPVYWEGAIETDGGRGYLELTGYFQALKL